VRAGKVRLDRKRPLETLPSRLEPLERDQGGAKIVVHLRILRMQPDRLFEEGQRKLRFAALVQQCCEQVHRGEVVGLRLQDRTIQLLGLGKVAALVRRDRFVREILR
jgi:hypothetical protein